jgi:hypothetical protein
MTLCIWISVEVKLACIGRVLAMPGHASLPLLEDRGDVLAGAASMVASSTARLPTNRSV